MRKRLFEIIESSNGDDTASKIYDYMMMATIVISMIPLAFKSTNTAFVIIDYVTATIFIFDYIVRLFTADYKLPKHGKLAYIVYPFTPMAIIDLISILPSLTIVGKGFRLLKVIRLFRTFRVLRSLKFLRYSKSVTVIVDVFKKQRKILITVVTMAVGYVLLSALIIFNVEPESFNTFFDAVYWATVSLTTVGYGDIYPVSTIGRIVTMISSIFGIAIIALPSGIITAGFLDELNMKNAGSEDKPDDK